jgi:hypothetical protein
MTRREAGFTASTGVSGLGMLIAATLFAVRAAWAQQPSAEAPTTVHGTVFDSLTHTPLAGARVAFVPAASLGTAPLATTTAANGTFEIGLASGRWLAAIEHPRFDSLGVDLPPRSVDVPRAKRFALVLTTPSVATITRAFCGPQQHASDVALVGMVRAGTAAPGLDSVEVLVQWVDLTLGRRGFARTLDTRSAHSDRNGWYVVCGVPAGAEVVAWAERRGATTGTIAISLPRTPARLDLVLDTTARAGASSSDLVRDSVAARDSAAPRDSSRGRANDARRPPMLNGAARYRAIVRDLSGHPIPNARARTLGHRYVLSDERGAVMLDSLPGGSQTLEVLAVGYAPERRVVAASTDNTPLDTVVLASLKSVLDTVRVTVGRDATGFEARRRGRAGQFITAADIVRENPNTTSSLLRTRDGVHLVYDRRGDASIRVSVAGDTACKPHIFVDGFPTGSGKSNDTEPAVPHMTGMPAVNWLVHPDEIGGVEIYTSPAQIPPEFAIWIKPPVTEACGAILFWTREKLGLPKAPPTDPP